MIATFEPTCPHCGKSTKPLTVGEKIARDQIANSNDHITIYGKPDVHVQPEGWGKVGLTIEATAENLRRNYAAAIDEAIANAAKTADPAPSVAPDPGWKKSSESTPSHNGVVIAWFAPDGHAVRCNASVVRDNPERFTHWWNIPAFFAPGDGRPVAEERGEIADGEYLVEIVEEGTPRVIAAERVRGKWRWFEDDKQSPVLQEVVAWQPFPASLTKENPPLSGVMRPEGYVKPIGPMPENPMDEETVIAAIVRNYASHLRAARAENVRRAVVAERKSCAAHIDVEWSKPGKEFAAAIRARVTK